MAFAAVERLIAFRYLRARREEGFISVIAAFSLVGGFPAVTEEGGQSGSSSSAYKSSSKSSSASSSTGYKIDLDYAYKKPKSSSGKKGHKVRAH